jgi:hypothetical protein
MSDCTLAAMDEIINNYKRILGTGAGHCVSVDKQLNIEAALMPQCIRDQFGSFYVVSVVCGWVGVMFTEVGCELKNVELD